MYSVCKMLWVQSLALKKTSETLTKTPKSFLLRRRNIQCIMCYKQIYDKTHKKQVTMDIFLNEVTLKKTLSSQEMTALRDDCPWRPYSGTRCRGEKWQF